MLNAKIIFNDGNRYEIELVSSDDFNVTVDGFEYVFKTQYKKKTRVIRIPIQSVQMLIFDEKE